MLDLKKIESILDTLDSNNSEDWELSFNQKRAWNSMFTSQKTGVLNFDNIKDVANRQRFFF